MLNLSANYLVCTVISSLPEQIHLYRRSYEGKMECLLLIEMQLEQ